MYNYKTRNELKNIGIFRRNIYQVKVNGLDFAEDEYKNNTIELINSFIINSNSLKLYS